MKLRSIPSSILAPPESLDAVDGDDGEGTRSRVRFKIDSEPHDDWLRSGKMGGGTLVGMDWNGLKLQFGVEFQLEYGIDVDVGTAPTALEVTAVEDTLRAPPRVVLTVLIG